jgi:hypothetical protein
MRRDIGSYEYWRFRAEQTRAQARTMRVEKFRNVMVAIADTYERLAKEAKLFKTQE